MKVQILHLPAQLQHLHRRPPSNLPSIRYSLKLRYLKFDKAAALVLYFVQAPNPKPHPTQHRLRSRSILSNPACALSLRCADETNVTPTRIRKQNRKTAKPEACRVCAKKPPKKLDPVAFQLGMVPLLLARSLTSESAVSIFRSKGFGHCPNWACELPQRCGLCVLSLKWLRKGP